MGTTIRAELSKKNPYWLEKHRYYELKHFCQQYPIWKQAYNSLGGLSSRQADLAMCSNKYNMSNPTERIAIIRSFYSERMGMIEKTAKETDLSLAEYIVIGVTEGMSYDLLRVNYNIPCGILIPIWGVKAAAEYEKEGVFKNVWTKNTITDILPKRKK